MIRWSQIKYNKQYDSWYINVTEESKMYGWKTILSSKSQEKCFVPSLLSHWSFWQIGIALKPVNGLGSAILTDGFS